MDNKITFIIAILWFVFFTKQMLFWFWLWQLKEYHWGRFKAHFETQAVKKILSSIWRFKYPKLTKKMIAMIAYSLLLEWAFGGRFLRLTGELFYLALSASLILSPIIASLIVLLFEMPSAVLRNKLLEKARQKRKQFKNLIVIGITGSYGKTSVKEFLYTILSEKFCVLKTPSHINAEVGIAQTILRELAPEHQIFIAEIGAYERGKISEVCWMLQPKIGILTGINEQHMSTFGSQENIIKGKFELIESLAEDGVAVLNEDNEIIQKSIRQLADKIQNDNSKFKIIDAHANEEKGSIWAEDINIEKERISFTVFTNEGEQADFEIALAGGQNVINILLATACAKELGMKLDEIASACRKIKPEQGSIQIKQGIDDLTILDSTYSANPDGVLADLGHLRHWSGRKIIVMPCLIELGSASKEIHQRIGESIGQVCDLAIITTNDYFQEIKNGALKSGMSRDKIILIEHPKKNLEKIKAFATPGDIILLEGRVPKQIINELLWKPEK